MDMDEFELAAEDVHMDEDTFHKLAVLKERKDYSGYPEKIYEHLFGFKTWKPHDSLSLTKYKDPNDFDGVYDLYNQLEDQLDKLERDYSTGGLGFHCNIERFGIPYGADPEQVAEFFARISEATEPFVVWHSNQEHHITDLHEMDEEEMESEVVYRIECRDGEAEVYEVEFKRTGEEKIVDTSEKGDE